jgi:hypothetical protein
MFGDARAEAFHDPPKCRKCIKHSWWFIPWSLSLTITSPTPSTALSPMWTSTVVASASTAFQIISTMAQNGSRTPAKRRMWSGFASSRTVVMAVMVADTTDNSRSPKVSVPSCQGPHPHQEVFTILHLGQSLHQTRGGSLGDDHPDTERLARNPPLSWRVWVSTTMPAGCKSESGLERERETGFPGSSDRYCGVLLTHVRFAALAPVRHPGSLCIGSTGSRAAHHRTATPSGAVMPPGRHGSIRDL